jgi:undecaprenyldiphospho-muramoylpentapeptide beta-N-acetylglucosaminyltransferase
VTGRRFAVVAGGGTAGHVLPALAVARALAARGHPAASIEMVGSQRGADATLLAGEGFGVTVLPGRGLVRRMGWAELAVNVRSLLEVAWAVLRAVVAVGRWRPAVVVSVGGYASFPAGVAAVVWRIPLVLVNVDAVPGLAHRLLGRFAAAAAVGFPGTPLPRAVVTGTPVRDELASVEHSAEAAARARGTLGLPPERRTVATFGGSLGARRINQAVAGVAEAWTGRADTTIYQVTGRRDWAELADRVPAAVAGTGRGPALCHRLVPYEEHMAELYGAADVVVCRAGAMTVAELAVAGVPAVLVPLPGAPDDHQTANARALVDAGAAVLLADADCEAPRLGPLLDELLDDPDRRAAMAEAARRLGRPGAAERVADLVEAVARAGGPVPEGPQPEGPEPEGPEFEGPEPDGPGRG